MQAAAMPEPVHARRRIEAVILMRRGDPRDERLGQVSIRNLVGEQTRMIRADLRPIAKKDGI